VVYNGLQPAGFSVGGGGGDTSGLYYSKVQLDGGQLDNRYYTETESDARFAYKSHNHDDLYYTKAQLNAGQLNNLYYTISEINDWRNSVTRTEMGYLHGVTSGIQGQINARAIISGTPGANQVAIWISGTQIKANPNFTFVGDELHIEATTNPKLEIQSKDEGTRRLRIEVNDTDNKIKFFSSYGTLGAYPFSFNRNALFDANIGTDNYIPETEGWQGNYAGEWDIRRLFTNELVAKTFIADIDLALLSGHIVSKSVTQVSRDFTVPANSNTGTLYVEALPGHPASQVFANNDWIRLQIIDRTGGGLTWVEVWGTVTSFVDDGNGEQHYTFTTQDDGGSSGSIVHGGAAAQDFGQSGDGFIQQEAGYETHTPWLQVATWVTDPSVPANINVRSRLGNLAGITGQSGYGLVTRKDDDNYVSQWWNSDADWGIRGYVGGNQVFRLGNQNIIGGFTLTSTSLKGGSAGTTVALVPATGIYCGTATPHTSDGWAAAGSTFLKDGSIHCPNFYVNAGGDVGFRAKEIIYAYLGVSNNIILSHDGESQTNSKTYVLRKTITLGSNIQVSKTLRIKFDIRVGDAAYTAYGQLLRNTTIVANNLGNNTTNWYTYSNDIAGWEAGDEINLKAMITGGTLEHADVRNFRVCGDQAEQIYEITGTNS